MDALSHYHRAEELLTRANGNGDAPELDVDGNIRDTLLSGIGHALLALAGVTALADPVDGMPLEDHNAWQRTVSITAPIPPETDDDPGEEPLISEGSVSPGRSDDPDVFAAWLRAVPSGSALTDSEDDVWYRVTSVLAAPHGGVRRFPALAQAAGEMLDDLTSRFDIEHAQMCAPFTVEALADRDRE